MTATATGIPGAITLRPSGGDDTSRISAAWDAAVAAGAGLFFSPGAYSCGTITKTTCPVGIWGIDGTVTITATNTSSWTWNIQGSEGSHVTLAADYVEADWQLHATTSGFAAGDMILIGDLTTPFPFQSTRYQGYTSEVFTVDSGSLMTPIDPPYTTFTTAASAFVAKITPVSRVRIEGLRFKNTNTSSLGGFIRCTYCRDVRIDMTGEGSGSGGVRLEHVLNADIRVNAKNYLDETIGIANQFGYGCEIVAACNGIRVEANCQHVRHAVSGGGYDTHYGEPINCVVTGVAHGNIVQGWDWHGQGRNVIFNNCISYGSRSYGFSLRGKGFKIHGGLVHGGYGGVWIFDGPGDLVIDGLKIKGARQTDASDPTTVGGNGILSQQPIASLTIRNCQIEGTDLSGIAIKGGDTTNKIQDVIIKGNVIRNVGLKQVSGEKNALRCFSPVYNCHVHQNDVLDNQGVKTTLNAFVFDSTSGNETTMGNYVDSGITVLAGAGAGSVTQL